MKKVKVSAILDGMLAYSPQDPKEGELWTYLLIRPGCMVDAPPFVKLAFFWDYDE